MMKIPLLTGMASDGRQNFAIPGTRRLRQGLISLEAIAIVAMLLLGTTSTAQASAELFEAHCGRCHNNIVATVRLTYNAAGKPEIIAATIAKGKRVTGTPAEHASIAAYLDSTKPSITLAPVVHNSPGNVITLGDITVVSDGGTFSSIGNIVSVSAPTKGTVSYGFAGGFSTPSSVTYQPFPGQSGTDTWTYQGTGGGLATTVRTASVVIAPAAGAQNTFVGQMSGSWWDPARSGEGQLINFESSGSRNVVFFAYFTYNANGQASWLVGNVDYQPGATSISIPLVTGTGARFGAAFRPADAQFPSSGTAVLEYVSCSQIRLRYAGSESFTLNLSRLVGPLIGAACS